VTMHDGLFVQDVRGLVPKGGGGGPSRRPPYFSVNVPPFDKWRLDVTLEGDRFLRARTTLFNGIASMKFRLTGALADPRAIGMVRVDSGQVLFPFAKFSLEDATVRLTEENPFDPQLAIFGTSRRYGYDLKLELTGTASVPNLVFTSSPPLTSEQVLLLVMAGQTPKNEVSYTTTQKFRQIGTFFGQSLLNSLGGGGGEDRLTISSGERISRQGRETYSVEYNLDKRWSLIGEYDEFDEYNAGLKWLAIPKPDEEKKNGRK
jgi:translocation and assembly module TamB